MTIETGDHFVLNTNGLTGWFPDGRQFLMIQEHQDQAHPELLTLGYVDLASHDFVGIESFESMPPYDIWLINTN